MTDKPNLHGPRVRALEAEAERALANDEVESELSAGTLREIAAACIKAAEAAEKRDWVGVPDALVPVLPSMASILMGYSLAREKVEQAIDADSRDN